MKICRGQKRRSEPTGGGRNPPIWDSLQSGSGYSTWHGLCLMHRSHHVSNEQMLVRQMQASQVQLPSICAAALICSSTRSTSIELGAILRAAAHLS